MLDYVYRQNEIVAAFVAQLIPHVKRGFGKCSTIGIVNDDGHLIAGLVFHDWSPEAGIIMVSAAALPRSRWLTRETIRRMLAYPFEQLDAQMIMHTVPADDERLLRQLGAGGYMMVRVPRLFGRSRDGVLAMFTREDWEATKFIKRPAALQEAA